MIRIKQYDKDGLWFVVDTNGELGTDHGFRYLARAQLWAIRNRFVGLNEYRVEDWRGNVLNVPVETGGAGK